MGPPKAASPQMTTHQSDVATREIDSPWRRRELVPVSSSPARTIVYIHRHPSVMRRTASA